MGRETGRVCEREERERERERGRQTGRQGDKEKKEKKGRETERQIERETDRKRDRETESVSGRGQEGGRAGGWEHSPPHYLTCISTLQQVFADWERSKAMGLRGRARCAEEFTWDNIAEQTERVYHETA